MPAGRYSFTIEQGATFSRTITWRDNASALIDLTGYTARMKVKDSAGATILELTTENSRITLGGAAGTIALLLTAAVTGALVATEADALTYDLELVSAGGTVTRLLQGRTSVSAQVSD